MSRWKMDGSSGKSGKGMSRPFNCKYCGKTYAMEHPFKIHERLCKDRRKIRKGAEKK